MARFSDRGEKEIEQLLIEKDSASTKNATKQAVRILREFCMEKGFVPEFETLDKSELDRLLKSFYANARKKDGTFYSKNTMNSIKYGISRFLLAEKKFNILEDASFSSSNSVFTAAMAKLKKIGMAKVNHHPEMSKEDLEKLYLSFDLKTPKGLQHKCMFDILFFLVRRGRENLRQQTKSTFAVAIDSQNRKYVYQAVDELDKNHRENDDPNDSNSDGRMYEQPGELCPVKSFELYLSKLHPELECLWQRPKENNEGSEIWYSKAPLGKNTLGNFMKDVSQAADLSRQYTNHSIRATAVTLLDHSNFEARHIMRVSGHKSESSIRSYSRRLSETKKREISDTLGLACGLSAVVEQEETATTSETSSDLVQLSSSQYDEALQLLASSPLPRRSLPGSPVLPLAASQTNTSNSLRNVTFAYGAFNNCNVTFNFNDK